MKINIKKTIACFTLISLSFSLALKTNQVKAINKTIINPIAFYEMKDEANLGKDSMGNFDLKASGKLDGISAIEGGGVKLKAGSVMYAPSFNGEGSYTSNLSSFTISFDYKNEDYADHEEDGNSYTNGFLISGGNYGGFQMHLYSRWIRLSAGTQYNVTTYSPDDFNISYQDYKTKWQNFTMTADSLTKKVTFYVDGVKRCEATSNEAISFYNTNPNYTLCLGGQCDKNGESIDEGVAIGGSFKNVKLYNVVLDDKQVEKSQANASIEVDSYQGKKAISIEEVSLEGEDINGAYAKLPKTLKVKLNDNSEENVKVLWNKNYTEISPLVKYEFAGVLLGNNILCPNVKATFTLKGGEVVKLSPVAWYQFTDASSLGKDSSGLNNHLNDTLKNRMSVVKGDEGGVYVDGTTALYSSAISNEKDFSDYITDYTIALRFKVLDKGQYSRILSASSYDNGFDVCYYGGNVVAYFGRDYANERSIEIGVGAVNTDWNFLAISSNKTTGECAVYLNGNLCGKQVFDPSLINFGNTSLEYAKYAFCLGGQCQTDGDAFADGFNGYLDDVRLYDTVLNEVTINSIMNDTKKEGVYQRFSNVAKEISCDYSSVDLVVSKENTIEKILSKMPKTLTLKDGDITASAKAEWYFENNTLKTRVYDCKMYNPNRLTIEIPLKYKLPIEIIGKGTLSINNELITEAIELEINKEYSVTLNSENGWYLSHVLMDNKVIKPTDNKFTFVFKGTMPTVVFNQIEYTLTYTDFEEENEKFGVEDEFDVFIPKKEGYLFKGWYLNKDCSGEIVSKINKGTTTNIVLYPRFVKIVSINFILNGGSFTDEVIYYANEGDTINLPLPIKDNYTFKGWYLNEELTNKADDSLLVGKDTIYLYAKYEAKDIKVIVIIDNKETEITLKYGDEIKSLPYSEKEGYIFVGYYSDSNFNNKIEFGTLLNDNDKVYGKYEKIKDENNSSDSSTSASEEKPNENTRGCRSSLFTSMFMLTIALAMLQALKKRKIN